MTGASRPVDAGVPGAPRVAVVLPALDEEATIGPLVAGLVPFTRGRRPLVHDLLVLDSGSTDRTAERAATAGARVLSREQALPGVGVLPGKGEALWRAVVALGAADPAPDVICFLDADLVDPHPELVPRLLAPLLAAPGPERPALVKGYHRRPYGGPDGHEGGRVTELLARPLLAALRPGLRGVRQPLGGEFAAPRAVLDRLPFASGYGVDIGLLLDAAALAGPDAIAQVDLGVRRHRNRPLHELGRTAREVLATTLDRCGVPDSGAGLVGFLPPGIDPPGTDVPEIDVPEIDDAGDTTSWRSRTHPLSQVDRPPPGTVRSGGPAGPDVPGAGRPGAAVTVGRP